MLALRKHSWLLALFIGFGLLYGAFQNVGYFDASDSLNRFYMMRALVTTGSPNWQFPEHSEPQVCLNSVGPAIAALPFQAIGYLGHVAHIFHGQLEQTLIRFTLLSTVFYTALWMCVLAQLCILLGSSKRKTLAITLVAGVGTLIFPYSKSAQAENLVGLCITSIIVLLFLYARSEKLRYVVGSGLLFGFLLTTKTELAAVFPLLIITVVGSGARIGTRKFAFNWKAGIAFCAAIVPGAAIILWFNFARFGNILTTGHLGDSHGSSLLLPFSHPFWRGLYLQTFSPGKGVFWYCPVLLASMPLLWMFLRKQRRLLLLPYFWWAMMTCVYAKWYSPAGDTALGSRFQVSYLAFGVLPLLALPSLSGGVSLAYKAWAVVCVSASAGLQILMCLVSFNIDFHRKLEGLSMLERYAHLQKLYYSFDESLLAGFFTTAREGLLDMYFVRLNPLESALTILPAFWWILAGSASAFGFAWYVNRKATAQSPAAVWPGLLAPQSPALCLALLGLFQVGYPEESGLRLKISNNKGASHKTVVQDIAIADLNNGRELYKITGQVEMQWSGELYCPQPGVYGFLVDSNRPLQISFARQDKNTEPGRSVIDYTVLDEGWQYLEIICSEVYMYDTFTLQCRFPGEESFKPLRSIKLKQE